MILISMALVLVGAVTLLIGFFNESRPEFIYTTIGTSLLAAVFLLLGVLRQRPSARQPALALNRSNPTHDSGHGTDSGGWGRSWEDSGGGVGTLPRDDADYRGVDPGYDDPRGNYETADDAGIDDADEVEDVHSADWWAPGEDEQDEYKRIDSTQHLATAASEYDESWSSADDDPAWERKDDGQPAAETWNGTAPEPSQPAWAAAETGVWDPLDPDTTSAAAAAPSARRRTSVTESAPAVSPSDRETERFLEALRPVRGVGPSKQSELLAHFKTLRRLRNATVERIAEVPGISTTLAQRIYNELHR